MQDSLEDYLKLTKSAKRDDPLKISKEMVITAQLKKNCDARAMKIVEFSIDGKLRPEVFTRCLPFINQGHYQDIVEERAITKLCGYSICGKRIPDMPKKQYFISTKSNKVYDITERKNYCSNFCYKASLHVKKQIDNSPLWLRKLEDIPEYKLLHSSEGGLPGEYIDQGMVKPAQDTPNFTSINTFAQASLGDITEQNNTGKGKSNKTRGFKKPSRLKSTMQTIKENFDEVEDENQPAKGKSTRKKAMKKTCIASLPSIEENEEKKENDSSKEANVIMRAEVEEKLASTSSEAKQKNPPKKSPLLNMESIIKSALDDWLTLETCIFIHGEQKVRQILNEQKLSDYFEELRIQELQRDQQMKYMEICRRLQLQEMAEEKFDNAFLGNNKLKPLPDFKRLKEDIKDMKLKVKAFYEGSMYEQQDKNFPTQINSKEDGQKESEEGPPAILPPVDLNSQNLLRKKIFMTSLSKAMQQLMQSLRAPYSMVQSEVQALVKTLNLKADNITFKPLVWSYVALVFLNLLSLKDESLKELLEEQGSQEYIQILFEPLPSKHDFIAQMLGNVRNIEVFVERHITKKRGDNV